MDSHTENWKDFNRGRVPSSLRLSPILFDYIKPGSRILDLGCGEGPALDEFAAKGFGNITGADINAEALQFAKKRFLNRGAKDKPALTASDASALPFRNDCFDCVITQGFWTTVIGNENRIEIIYEIRRVLKNDGLLYICDFARNDDIPLYRERYKKGKESGFEEGTFEAAAAGGSGACYLAHHYTIEEFENLARHAGLKILRYSLSKLITQSGNDIDGHVIIATKPDPTCAKCS